MILTLDPVKFEFIHEGFIVGGSLERTKNMLSMRMELKILDKLEEVSVPYPCGKKLPPPINEVKRKLKSDEEEIELDFAELEMIKRYMGLVPWATGEPVRNFFRVYDWLESHAEQKV